MRLAGWRAGSRIAGVGLALALLGGGCGDPGGAADGGGVQPAFSPTYANVNDRVFNVGCGNTLTGLCHAKGAGPVVGSLDLATNPYLALLGESGQGAPAAPASSGSGYSFAYTGLILVKPGDPDHSLLYQKLTLHGPSDPTYGFRMPYVNPPLPAGVIEAVREWIANGAKND